MPNLVGIWDPEADEGRIREILAQQLGRVRVPGSSLRCAHPPLATSGRESGPRVVSRGPRPPGLRRSVKRGMELRVERR